MRHSIYAYGDLNIFLWSVKRNVVILSEVSPVLELPRSVLPSFVLMKCSAPTGSAEAQVPCIYNNFQQLILPVRIVCLW